MALFLAGPGAGPFFDRPQNKTGPWVAPFPASLLFLLAKGKGARANTPDFSSHLAGRPCTGIAAAQPGPLGIAPSRMEIMLVDRGPLGSGGRRRVSTIEEVKLRGGFQLDALLSALPLWRGLRRLGLLLETPPGWDFIAATRIFGPGPSSPSGSPQWPDWCPTRRSCYGLLP